MTVLTVVTHLAAFCLGVITARWVTLRTGGRMAAVTDSETPPRPPRQPLVTPVIGVVLAAAIVILGLGVQQSLVQGNQSDTNECLTTWANDMTSTLDTRVQAANKVTRVSREFGNASLGLLDVLSQRVTDPPEALNDDLLRARIRYASKKDAYDTAVERATQVREANPYPILDCP